MLVGVDYGTRRIGLAIADPEVRLASPLLTLTTPKRAEANAGRDASGAARAAADAERVATAVAEYRPTRYVVGLPLSMDGTDSAQTRLTRAFAAALQTHTGVPVDLWDERLSSFQADELAESAGIRKGQRKAARDALAALVILQSYLARDARDDIDPTAPSW